MSKYKATITCDRKVWEQFKIYCTKQGSNSSNELEKFMRVTLSNDLEKAKKLEVYPVIECLVEKFIAQNLRLMLPPLQFTEVNRFIEEKLDKCLGSKIQAYLADNPQLLASYHLQNTNNTDDTTNTDATDDTGDTGDTDDTNKQDYFFTDQYVALAENLSPTSVHRYRTGKRKPKDKTFFDRWKYNVKKKAWEKLNV